MPRAQPQLYEDRAGVGRRAKSKAALKKRFLAGNVSMYSKGDAKRCRTGFGDDKQGSCVKKAGRMHMRKKDGSLDMRYAVNRVKSAVEKAKTKNKKKKYVIRG